MMRVMTPGEAMDAQLAVVADHLADIMANVALLEYMDEPDKAELIQGYLQQAHRYIITNLTEALVIRAITNSVWAEANERAQGILGQIQAFYAEGSAE